MDKLSDAESDSKIKMQPKNDSSSLPNMDNNLSQDKDEQIVQKISLFAENFDVARKTEETSINLTKRWITATKKIEIPIKYEELLINDKEFDHYNEREITEIFSKIKHKITDVFSHHDKDKYDTLNQQGQQQIGQEHLPQENGPQQGHEHKQQNPSTDIDVKRLDEQSGQQKENNNSQNEEQQQQQQQQEQPQGQQSSNRKLIPLSLHDNKDNGDSSIINNSNSSSKKQEENHIIPLWGEEITINKKMVKIGEIVIRKYQISEKQKIDVDVKSEKLIVRYPDSGQTEEIV